jgi:hypothetical protein
MVAMVDSYRFLDGVAKRVMQHWSSLRAATPIPWTPLAKPLSQCTIAFVSAAALALNCDRPFDVQIEHSDPWFSDSSYRLLPRNTRTGEVQSFHLHINPEFAKQDLNCVMPLERLAELVARGGSGGVRALALLVHRLHAPSRTIAAQNGAFHRCADETGAR